MVNDVHVLSVPRGYLAVVQGTATHANLSLKIREYLDQVYASLARGTVRQAGLNVVLYRGAPDRDLLASPEGCPIEAGVQVAAPFESGDGLVCSSTPGGMVATAVHMGPYTEMGRAYDALFAWRRDTGRLFTGTFWEVYGDWSDQPDQLRTDVFFLLAP